VAEKVEVNFWETEARQGVSCQVKGKTIVDHPQFATYEDHRMAMAFAPLAMFGNIKIEEPMVVFFLKQTPRCRKGLIEKNKYLK